MHVGRCMAWVHVVGGLTQKKRGLKHGHVFLVVGPSGGWANTRKKNPKKTLKNSNKQGLKHGHGYLWWANSNEAHQGDFEKDLPHGHGIRYYPNGEVYQGACLSKETYTSVKSDLYRYYPHGEVYQGVYLSKETYLVSTETYTV